MEDFIELQIVSAVRELLSGRVNEILNDWQNFIPLFEISDFQCGMAVVPKITLSECELTEKERIIRLDAYSITISFSLQETPEAELFCYAYTNAVCKALREDPTLGGVIDRVTVCGKKYIEPKKQGCGQDWEVVIGLRATVENQITGNK